MVQGRGDGDYPGQCAEFCGMQHGRMALPDQGPDAGGVRRLGGPHADAEGQAAPRQPRQPTDGGSEPTASGATDSTTTRGHPAPAGNQIRGRGEAVHGKGLRRRATPSTP